jgi:hypothetical protein
VPVAKLFIEGRLDAEVLNPVFQGSPVLQQGGTKGALKSRARAERLENRVAAGYLRDRDFDFDPPVDRSTPTIDSTEGGVVLGWRWCRHEIENYLIDPGIVCAATAWPLAEIEAAFRQAARRIRSYEAARWTIGTVRRALPPSFELRTRPEELNEIELPQELGSAAVQTWVVSRIEDHRSRIAAAMDAQTVREFFEDFSARFDEDFIADVMNVVCWFSGKDLLAGMNDWLSSRGIENPGAFRALLRDWIIANPVRTLELLPEWSRLAQALRT